MDCPPESLWTTSLWLVWPSDKGDPQTQSERCSEHSATCREDSKWVAFTWNLNVHDDRVEKCARGEEVAGLLMVLRRPNEVK